MALKPILAVVLLASLALAGCSGGGKDGDGDPPTTSTGPSGTSTSTGPRPNQPPTAGLNASATNGTSPLNVTFSLSGADPDGDALNWTLSFGDGGAANGTSLPASVSHVYNGSANSTMAVVLTVTDGRANATANVTVALTVEPSGPGATILQGEVAMACDTPGLCYVVGANGCVGWNARQQGLDCVWMEVPAELVGLPFVTESAGDVDLDFRTDCELTGESIEIFGADGQEEGAVPEGTGCVVLSDFVAPGLLQLLVG